MEGRRGHGINPKHKTLRSNKKQKTKRVSKTSVQKDPKFRQTRLAFHRVAQTEDQEFGNIHDGSSRADNVLEIIPTPATSPSLDITGANLNNLQQDIYHHTHVQFNGLGTSNGFYI